MADDVDRWTEYRSPIASVAIEPVEGTPMWSIRVTVAYPSGAESGWAPFVFFSEEAAAQWLSGRVRGRIMPCVRECTDGPQELAIACIATQDGVELLMSEPMPRHRAAGVAAMFAAEFRSHQQS